MSEGHLLTCPLDFHYFPWHLIRIISFLDRIKGLAVEAHFWTVHVSIWSIIYLGLTFNFHEPTECKKIFNSKLNIMAVI